MTAAAPLRRLRRGGAAAVAACAMWALSAYGNAVCVWQGDRYICSGDGSAVQVIGGGEGVDVTITNFWGVCTNCVSMSPDYCETLKGELLSSSLEVVEMLEYLTNNVYGVWGFVQLTDEEVRTFRRFGFVDSPLVAGSSFVELTNYVYTVDNAQTRLVRAYRENPNSAFGRAALIGFNDGIYDYGQSLLPSLSSANNSLNEIRYVSALAADRTRSLSERIDQNLICTECQPDYEPGGFPGESGGGSVPTNGNWCTFEQGEAIKELLNDIKKWQKDTLDQVVSISNSVASIDDNLRRGLFSSYTHIPTEEELQATWQDLYLTGYNPNFHEYQSTNIVARIELLLAGISGVLTNSSDYASQDEFADESLVSTNLVEEAFEDVQSQIVDVTTGRAQSSQTVGNALIRLYQKFRTWSGSPFSTEYIINSYSVEFESGKALDVPGFSMAAKTVPWANTIRVICRSAMTVIWILMTVAVFVRFQIAFFEWCFKYVKWAVEVLQGLFV